MTSCTSILDAIIEGEYEDFPDVQTIEIEPRPRCNSPVNFGGPKWEPVRRRTKCIRKATYIVGGQPLCRQHAGQVCLNYLLGAAKEKRQPS